MVGWVRLSGGPVRSQTQASPVFARGDQGKQAQPGAVGQGLQHAGKADGLTGGDRLTQQRHAARTGQRKGRPVLDAGRCAHVTARH